MILGSAIDIVEHCRVPRFYFVDFPLGNPCGKPYDLDMQRQIVRSALKLFETVTEPGQTHQDPNTWGANEWRERYMQIMPEDTERLRVAGERRRQERQRLRDSGQVRSE